MWRFTITTTVIDVESTIFQKGNPFARKNKLCFLGAYPEGGTIHVGDESFIPDFQRLIDDSTTLVGFNIKFDLHWLARQQIGYRNKRIWDCQFARFLLEAQRIYLSENSLAEACKHYGATPKSSHIEENYWSKGIDTPDIPRQEVLDYLTDDLKSTMEVYHKQREQMEQASPQLRNLFNLHMQDLLVLQEMEFNGLRYNTEKSLEEARQLEERIATIEARLRDRCPNTPINFDSGDDLSAYLYGGVIERQRREPVGVFQTGVKKGQPRFKVVVDKYTLLRLVEPLAGSELKKADKEKETGPWSTSEDVLKQLPQKEEVKLLLERAKLTKLLDYLSGFPSLIVEKDWSPNELHGQFNQVVARTGRLSSSSPNLQNLPDPVLALVETRYAAL